MALFIRMGLYLIFGATTGIGIWEVDHVAGTLIVDIEALTSVLTGLGGFAATFVASRYAKSRGGKT